MATVGILAQSDLRSALHAPGWRGLVWLGLLVAVRLSTRRPGAATAVAATASLAVLLLGLAPHGTLGVVRAGRSGRHVPLAPIDVISGSPLSTPH